MDSPLDIYIDTILGSLPESERGKLAEQTMLTNLKRALEVLQLAKSLNDRATSLPPNIQQNLGQAIDEFNEKIADIAQEILKFELPDML